MGRKRDPERAKRIRELVDQGFRNTQIAKELGIDRSTVGRYRSDIEKDDVARRARILLVRDAWAQHFADLHRVLDDLRDQIIIPSPGSMRIDDFSTQDSLPSPHPRLRPRISWETNKEGIPRLCVPVQRDPLFECLRQHTKTHRVWKSFDAWATKGGQFLLVLSSYWNSIKSEAEESTGLATVDDGQSPGLRGLPIEIYESACGVAFPGDEPRRYQTFGIIRTSPSWYELKADGILLAQSSVPQKMTECRQAFEKMTEAQLSGSEEPAPELSEAVDTWKDLQRLQEEIGNTLLRMKLKRTLPGHCDLCPS